MQTTRITHLGTWNIRSLNGKEIELIDEFEKADLDILAITETKKKGKGIIKLKNDHILVYSGVENNERARAGVGCIINKQLEQSIKEWECVNERILIIKIDDTVKITATIMILYGMSEDETKANKDEFWDKVQIEYEKLKEPIYIVGDLNARVGNKNKGLEEIMGKHGEPSKNSNGNRLIDFCIVNELKILNTFFEHKDIHKYTREERSRNEKSLIDYFLSSGTQGKEVKDIKVKRGCEIGSDHYLVTAKIKKKVVQAEIQRKDTARNETKKDKFRINKLQSYEVREEYKNRIKTLISSTRNPDLNNIEDMWTTFKYIITEATKYACGTIRETHNRKQTHWWNAEVKVEVKKKKQKWKKYLNTKNGDDYEDYKRQRKIVKEAIKKSKERTWEEFGNTLEENFKENQKLFYRTLKCCKNRQQPTLKQLHDKQGRILKKEDEIIKRWKEHFEELLEESQTCEENERKEEQESGIARIDIETEAEEITKGELINVLNKLRNGKAPGHDNIKPEQLKYMGEEGEQILLKMLNKIWELGKIPTDWEKAVIFPIYKKGDNRNCSNYRGISLLCTAAKVYEAILENKLRQVTTTTMEKAQSGFMKGHSTQDHIFTIRKLTEDTLKHDGKLFIAFIDLEKAFDRVPREKMWNTLRECNISEQLLKAIKSVYRRTANYIRTGNQTSDEFMTTQGLRQGGALSPLLFILFLDGIIKNIKYKTKKVEVGYQNLTRITISECAFADDLAIIAKNETDLQHNINIWKEELDKHNMNINIEKTKVMVISKEDTTTNITIDGKEIEQVESFIYLGSALNNRGSLENEINNRIRAANKSYFAINKIILNNKQISKKTKMTLYKTVFRPTLIYGSETWTMSHRVKSKIQAAEMRYLRKVEGVTKFDRVRNEHIRLKLQTESIQTTIDKKQLAWYGHIIRMPEDRQTKLIWRARTTKKKRRGRPQKTWEDYIQEILERNNINIIEARKIAKNRKEWRELIEKIK